MKNTTQDIARYNSAVSRYQQACKKHKIKVADHQYRHMSNETDIPFVLYTVAGNVELTKLVSTIQALRGNASRICTLEDTEKFLGGLNWTFYQKNFGVILYEITANDTLENKVTLKSESYGDIEIVIKNPETKLELSASPNTLVVLSKYNISKIMQASAELNLTELLLRVQKTTIDILMK